MTISTTTRERRLTSAAFALAAALVLTACGGGGDTATPDAGPSADHGGAHSGTPSAGAAATADDADVAFLTGMKPHHEQAVEMSDLVLAAQPPAPVAELAQRVKAAQGPEIEQMEEMLTDLGEEHGRDGSMEHGGMMSDSSMEQLMDATGTEAARLYLEGMIEHHRGAIAAAETQIAAGQHQPAVELAEQIAQDQAAEIEEMEGLLASL